MLSCAEFEVLLADWIDETLAAPGREAEQDAFLRHLESCPSCAALAEDSRFAVTFMERAADVEVPPVLLAKILHATNEGWEFKLRGRGFIGWINRTFAPVLRPRFVMGAMLTLMSATILARGCGVTPTTFTAADVNPVRLWASLDNRTHRIWDRAVKSYESMRLVYEVKSEIAVWSEQQRQEEESAADARANKKRLDSPATNENTGENTNEKRK